MSPRKPAAPVPRREWRREAAGAYRSADDRFTLEGGETGSWYVRDDEATDELGLPRTTGPYATLAGAKAAAADQRDRAPEVSPLAARVHAANADAARPQPGKNVGRAASPPAAVARAAPQAAAPRPPRPKAPAPPSWLDTLESDDRAAAQRARGRIRDLAKLGLSDPEGTVRRDLLGGQPEVATRLLIEAIRRAMTAKLSPGVLAASAGSVGIAIPESAQDLAETVAAHAVARTLEVMCETITRQERLPKAPSTLPGWELLERGPGRRRIRIVADDLR